MRPLGPVFPNFGWVSKEEYERDNLVEDDHSNCTSPDSSLGVSESSEGNRINNNSAVIKKLIHNANERNRRKKTNSLFSTLRSCLPGSDENLSNPRTISRSMQYIPELKEQVKKLTQKKEDILVRISGQRGSYVMPQPKVASSYVSTVFATELTDTEVMVQISSSKNHNFSIYNVLSGLEEDGFVLVDVSSSSCWGERLFYTLHLQVDKVDSYKLICEDLSRRVLFLFEKCGKLV
ncbi:Transcription factor ORG2 [Raphanus sativus]|uniref:Transcription factor ORG3-like n=1 Tax=Raphanus sativus TaxID=3726 RepID=A0A9W3DSN5_RAPSA|nr:transcription factor ORG3-like [Raphanus sativus]KAJ4894408.1 Transcription factor ORG2 [Raphanus sativus]